MTPPFEPRTPLRRFEHSSAAIRGLSSQPRKEFEYLFGLDPSCIVNGLGRLLTMAEPRWLNATEQLHWRAYVAGSTQLWEVLDRDLKTGHGLTMAEYEILVRLSESPGRRLRMAELAESAYQSRSRLSHTCSRLESKGLVSREPCEGDKRGVNAIL